MELFGSRVPASSYISIAIHEADERRRLQGSQHMVGRYITKIAMTEAQFATMVGAVGAGSGVPCTIEYRHTAGFAQMPAIEDFSLEDDRARHIRELTARSVADVREAAKMMDELLAEVAPTKTKLRAIRAKLVQAADHAPANYQFAADRVSEHLADTMAEVKMELHAYALATDAALARGRVSEADIRADEIEGGLDA
ncbi:MAG: hypothetical protein DI527_00460 [Chelatococcus sp.]|nr:MAG: hypothetical protein DI527_00460 [Chelatococcus sp.]